MPPRARPPRRAVHPESAPSRAESSTSSPSSAPRASARSAAGADASTAPREESSAAQRARSRAAPGGRAGPAPQGCDRAASTGPGHAADAPLHDFPGADFPGVDPSRADPRSVDALLCGSPREVLARIVPGDPLGVRDAVAEVLRAECVFLDADRVHLRALARIARAALRHAAARDERANWLRSEVVAAVHEVLREEAEAPRADAGATFAQFARPLGLDPEAVRRGCAAFNRLPRADRAAFFALVVRNVGLEALARATGEPPSALGRRARRGLDAVLHAHHPDLPPPARPPAKPAADATPTDTEPAR